MADKEKIIYSDGSVESAIVEYLTNHDGNTDGIIDSLEDGAVFHNFTPLRTNLLRWYPFKKGSSVLEIGAGMGALTPALADCCGDVVALEESEDRAHIISLRCQNCSNVQVVVGNLDDYDSKGRLFDYVLLIGVLEYAGVSGSGSDPWLAMLKKAKGLLAPDGKLLLAIENKFGLKYWCGAAEDHTGIPFDSINDYSESNGSTRLYSGLKGVRTFSKYELENLLSNAGFAFKRFYYLLPDYKFPMLALSDDSIDADTLVQDIKYSYSEESALIANEAELYPQIVKNGALSFFSNSFLVEASVGGVAACDVITAVMKRDYRPRYRLTTVIADDYVLRVASCKDSVPHVQELINNTCELQNKGIPCVAQEDLGDGKTKSERIFAPRADEVFIQALQSGDTEMAIRMLKLLRHYLCRSSEMTEQDGKCVLSNGYVDMTFRNSFWVNEDLLFFDQEWKQDNVPLNYIMFRSLNNLSNAISSSQMQMLLDHCGISEEETFAFAAEEERFLASLMDRNACKRFDKLMYQDRLKLSSKVDAQMKNKEAHIEQLLQSERDLVASVSQKESTLKNLRHELNDYIVRLNQQHKDFESVLDRLQQCDRDFQRLSGECQQLQSELRCREGEYQQLQNELLCREGECQQLRDKENRLKNDLEATRNSRTWRIGRIFTGTARFFIPVGSKRALFCRLLWTMVRHPVVFFKSLSPRKIKKFFRLLSKGQTENIGMLIRSNVTGEPAPSAIEVSAPEIVKVEPVKEKTIDDYPVLQVPQWEDPQVSIVIPVYNQFEFTYHCVESIMKNSGDITYEIIIANDCSTDLTTQIDKILPGVICVTNEKNLRFLRNCNNAAKYAKGQYILFLNNDTQVQPNWLEPLVTLIESSDEIGMVGSKLIYPDGLLQEAGGILWRDGSAWNFGNRQNPALPQFNYVKQVDYISGAAIMLSRALWEEIGGFDDHFAPAYCEDSDLAFTVRKMGYKVMYQPLSVVVHFEGVSNGTDTSSGQKKYQIENSIKFREKWAEELAKHPENGENVFQARDYSFGKKTLLMVDHYVPHFDKDAGSRTVFQYLKLFVKAGFNVKFIGDNFYQHEPYTTVLQQMGIEVLYGPECANNWKQWIRDNAEHFDYVFLNRPHIAPKYLDFIRQNTKAKIMYYGHDLAFLREMREYEITGDASFRDSAIEWQPKELALMRSADMAYYPSYVEVDEIHNIDPDIKVKAIPAYLFEDVKWEGYDFDSRKDIMFIGGFGHRPNVDAVKWIANEILPELLKLLPDVKIHILGSNAPKEVLALANEHLIIEGFVTDEQLEWFYRNVRISLVPLRYGAGIKGKVVEAMRFGTPVVTTSTGAEGIPNADQAMVIEDDSKALAEKLAALYNDPEKLAAMSRNCISYIQGNYSPSNAISVIGPEFDLC